MGRAWKSRFPFTDFGGFRNMRSQACPEAPLKIWRKSVQASRRSLATDRHTDIQTDRHTPGYNGQEPNEDSGYQTPRFARGLINYKIK